MGKKDPAFRLTQRQAQFCLRTPQGPVSIQGTHVGDSLAAECQGPGCEWVAPHLPSMFGLHDTPESFRPEGKLRDLVMRLPGLHLPRLPIVFYRLVQIVLQQLVSWTDAYSSWRRLVQEFGEDAPGRLGLRLPPAPETLRSLAYFDLVACGILPRQARLVLHLARNHSRIENSARRGEEHLARFLRQIPGIGDWTIAYILGSGLGAADALLIGDYNMPHTVSWFLTGKARGNDAQMVRLLEPFRGNRFRVVALLWQSGTHAPRFGPRMQSNRAHLRTGRDSRRS